MKHFHNSKKIVLAMLLLSKVFVSNAQTFINWTANTGTTPHTWTGTYTGGTVSLTQGATGNDIINWTPIFYTNLNGASGSQAFATQGPETNDPCRSLTFTFSTPVIINELNIADIDASAISSWNDAFTFSGVNFTSVTGANVTRTTTSATPTGGDFGQNAEWARWVTSTTPITSFTINYLTTSGATHAILYYSMKVTVAPCVAGTAAPTF